VVYRQPKGKYDAINFSIGLIPQNAKTVIMNDVDTKIHNLETALRRFVDEKADILFAAELVREGPQNLFFRLQNPIRRRIPLAASGELMLIRRSLLARILPIRPCKADDTYILFKALESGYKVIFSEECLAETERTKTAREEESYKRRTVAGIYQALSFTHPPLSTRLFFLLLPIASPLLLIGGEKGYYWMKGILLGLTDYLRGDRSGYWPRTYS